MDRPDREKIKELIESYEFAPMCWTDFEQEQVYEQLKNLYEHWYREEL